MVRMPREFKPHAENWPAIGGEYEAKIWAAPPCGLLAGNTCSGSAWGWRSRRGWRIPRRNGRWLPRRRNDEWWLPRRRRNDARGRLERRLARRWLEWRLARRLGK